MFALEGVSKHFGQTRALDGIDLTMRQDGTTVLIGPSGCGKSTLLRLLVGLEFPDVGRVLVDRHPLDDARLPALRRRLGYVIQEGGLFPHLSAERNASLAARHQGWEAARIRERLLELAELTHFPTDAFERPPAALSGGQRQRLALMRALMLDPDVLLLDEPLGALDPMIRAALQDDLQEIFKKLQKTVVMVTHDLAEAAWFADEVVLLRTGRIVQRGPFSDLVERPAEDFVQGFVQAQRRELGGKGGS